MSAPIATTVEHDEWNGDICATNFSGERDALAMSEFLRPLLPPDNRKYITHRMATHDGKIISRRVTSCHRKHGGIRIRIVWITRNIEGESARILSRQQIIDLSRNALNDALGRPAALLDWPFPMGVLAA